MVSRNVGQPDEETREAQTKTAGGVPPVPRTAPEVARGTSIGRYVILGTLGRGGMGIVYDAFDPDLDRRVAVKQLLAGASPDEQVRLLREAQSLAKVTHPNVVTVFDVGEHGKTVFLAMERVQGQTLKDWLVEPRPWREVLNHMVAAGRGLAAVHAAHLVHRDFKPSNLLLGDDGKIRLMDFGIAFRSDQVAPPSLPSPSPTPEIEQLETFKEPSGVWQDRLTMKGALIGTLGYLSPEQVEGGPADERSDQFSFCTTLYRALYREHPFGWSKASSADALDALCRGAVLPPNPEAKIPRWLRAIVLRGLSREPSQRYPSMNALLDDVQRHLAQRPRWVAIAAALAAVFAIAVFAWVQSAPGRACRQLAGEPLDAWDESAKSVVQEVFLRSGARTAAEKSAATVAALDVYAQAWMNARSETCEATRVRHEVSEDILERRMNCLGRKRQEVGALVELFQHADSAMVDDATDAVYSLEIATECLDVAATSEMSQIPTDSATLAAATQLYRRIAEIKALLAAGRAADAVPLSKAVLTESLPLNWPVIELEARELAARALRLTNDLPAAERGFEEAVFRAIATGLPRQAALNSMHLAFLLTTESQQRFAEAERWIAHARALFTRLDGEAIAVSRLAARTGSLHVAKGQFEEAVRWLHIALEWQQKMRGENDPTTATVHNNLGAALARMGDHTGAEKHYQAALAIFRATSGPSHPSIGVGLHNLALLSSYRGHFTQAEALIREALTIQLKALGDRHRKVATSRQVLAHILTRLGRCSEAEPLQRQALLVLEPASGTLHARAVAAKAGLAECHWLERPSALVESEVLEAVKLARPLRNKEPTIVASVLMTAAQIKFEERKWPQALELSEEALTTLAAYPTDVILLARVRFLTAQCLRVLRIDETRSTLLATQARSAVAAPDTETPQLRADVEGFLALKQ